jgi:hypothetical protein
MKNIISLPFETNVIENICNHLLETSSSNSLEKDFSKTAIIFGGKRPSLFLNSAISKKLKTPFFPPTYFTMDSFVEYILNQHLTFSTLNSIDAYYIIYTIAKNFSLTLFSNTSFTKYFSWAQEIFTFIENLDLENIDNKNLKTIESIAEIGYDIPKNINLMLENISQIRELFHKKLLQTNTYSRGLKYLTASKLCSKTDFLYFDKIFFVNLFYLHNTEVEIIKDLLTRFPQKTVLYFCGDKNCWSVLKSVEKKLEIEIPLISQNADFSPKINFYCGYDTHSQIGIVREIIKTFPQEKLSSTVIVLPDEKKVFPLLYEITSLVKELNISLGYSLQYTTIYSLIETIFSAQLTKTNRYYTKDYLNILSHPVVKSYLFDNDNTVTKTLIQTIENFLTGVEKNVLSTSITVDLTEIESLDEIYISCIEKLENFNHLSVPQLQNFIKMLHNIFFRSWEKIASLKDFINILKDFIFNIVQNTEIKSQPTNLQSAEVILTLCDELSTSLLTNSLEKNLFTKEELYQFFSELIKSQKIAFKGSPLKGLQILGLLETRSLSFENVIIIDVNETVLPKIKIYEPLIPREIMLQLGINKLEKEEEIQKYHFTRLISCAKNVYLIYIQNDNLERSRFIEELLWEKQKKLNLPQKISVPKGSFKIDFIPRKTVIYKNSKILDYLKKLVFSSSSIDTYIKCPLQFYFRYVLNLSEKEVLSSDIESDEIGTFIHKFLKDIFSPYINKPPKIGTKFENKFYNLLEKSFNETFLKRMKSDYYLLKEVIFFWLKDFLEFEQERVKETKKILCLEKTFFYTYIYDQKKVMFKSIIDRIDLLKDDTVLILDYKTGSKPSSSLKNLLKYKNEPMSRIFIKEKIKSFQLPLYIKTVAQNMNFEISNINATFYCLKEKSEKLSFYLNQKSFLEKSDDKTEGLKFIDTALNFVLTEIFDIKIPFEADKNDETNCNNCDFISLCK